MMFVNRLATVLFFGLPCLAQFYTYQPLGCVSTLTPQSSGLHYPETEQAADCANLCYNYRYMYVRQNPLSGTGYTEDCYCEGLLGDNPGSGDPNFITPGYTTGLLNTDPNQYPWKCNDSDYTAYILQTTFAFQGCYGGQGLPTVYPSDALTIFVDPETDVNAAFQDCAYTTYALVIPSPTGNGYIVVCGSPQSYSGGSPAACSYGVPILYTHDTTSASSGLTRRKMPRSKMRNQLCPMGLTACYVRPKAAKDEYECIDTSEELESCGGCMYGSPSYKRIPKGVDCTAIDGVLNTAVTCSYGLCEVAACEDGWFFDDGHCVREWAVQ